MPSVNIELPTFIFKQNRRNQSPLYSHIVCAGDGNHQLVYIEKDVGSLHYYCWRDGGRQQQQQWNSNIYWLLLLCEIKYAIIIVDMYIFIVIVFPWTQTLRYVVWCIRHIYYYYWLLFHSIIFIVSLLYYYLKVIIYYYDTSRESLCEKNGDWEPKCFAECIDIKLEKQVNIMYQFYISAY